jgi:palmitoyltransferase ZDHHC13/17
MMFLFLILSVMLLLLYGGITYYKDFTLSDGIWNAFLSLNNSLWVPWMIINASFHLFWVTILTSIQIYQIVFMGMTTNERINRGRYKHFTENNGKSPFNLGPWGNIVDFIGVTCFGLLKVKKNNWMVFVDKESANLISPNEDLQYV